MLQAPRHSRYRNWHKMRISPISHSNGGGNLSMGSIGLNTLKAGRFFFNQLEASRRVISRKINNNSRLWLRGFPDVPLTRNPSEIRMGNGKGTPHTWVHSLNAGNILLEVNNISGEDLHTLLNNASKNLPIPCAIVQSNTVRLNSSC